MEKKKINHKDQTITKILKETRELISPDNDVEKNIHSELIRAIKIRRVLKQTKEEYSNKIKTDESTKKRFFDTVHLVIKIVAKEEKFNHTIEKELKKEMDKMNHIIKRLKKTETKEKKYKIEKNIHRIKDEKEKIKIELGNFKEVEEELEFSLLHLKRMYEKTKNYNITFESIIYDMNKPIEMINLMIDKLMKLEELNKRLEKELETEYYQLERINLVA